MQILWEGSHTDCSSCQGDSDGRQRFPGSVTATKEWDEKPGPGWAPAAGGEGTGGKSR